MRRLTNFYIGSDVPAGTLNALQDEQRGLAAANRNPSGSLALAGSDGRYVCTPDAGVADGTIAILDESVDWTNRAVSGLFIRLESPAQRLHGASAWQRNDTSRPIVTRYFAGGTGAGGHSTGGGSIATGIPPAIEAGSLAIVLDEAADAAHRIWLFADPSSHKLCLYNATGATLHAEAFLEGSVVPANPPGTPDVIPTITDVIWLAPSVIADRPTNPGAPAIHRATDSGDISLFDVSALAWRSIGGGGGGSPVVTKTTTYTAVAGDVILANAAGGAFTITLPAAAGATKSVSVKKIDNANSVTIAPAAGTIDGAGTLVLATQYDAVELWSDGTNWWVF